MRLIIDPPAKGAWNMGVDQALLESANESGVATFRIYRWSPATLSLGYFQKYADRAGHAASSECDVVRRSSGGGAILHDRELTYSLCLPHGHQWAGENEALYQLVHRLIVDVMLKMGIVAEIYDSSKANQDSAKSKYSFLCFQRRTDGDLVLGRWKIGGSAQRRLDKSLIQHGSLLLSQSEFAPELPGIEQLVPKLDMSRFETDFVESWIAVMAGHLGVVMEPGGLESCEIARAKALGESRFDNQDWTEKR